MASAATNSPTEIDPKARFFRYFQHEVTALQEEIAQLAETSVSGGERADGVEHCLAGIARLSNEVKESSSRIPVYDLRTYDEAIKALSEKLQKTRASFAPRPKFTFKSAMRTRSSLTSPKKEDRGRSERRFEESSWPKSAPATMQDNPVNGNEDAVENGENGNGATKEFQRQTTNKYDQVDDFNWLKAERNPHWRVLPPAERTEESVWRKIVPREADINVENILQVTKVIRESVAQTAP
ncbi:MAG: hypothetical protein Q9157_004010 [Trypethelium eluteriae]